MGSADWMPRNLDRRVELVFPIDDQDLKERAFGILELMLSDTVNARIQQPDTTYAHIDKRGKAGDQQPDRICPAGERGAGGEAGCRREKALCAEEGSHL